MTISITSLPSATTPLTGTERVPLDQTVGTAVAATALVVGTGYRIETVGTTNWTACGLPAEVTAAVGLTFVATAAGTGTGTAIEARTVETTTQAIADLASAGAGTDLTYDPATRLLSSSTGEDVTLPLVSPTAAGLLSAAGWLKLDSITVDRATLTVAPVRNNSGASIAKGTPVIVTGSNGTTKTIAPADASSEETAANTLGLTLDVITNNADGFVITEGPLSGVNTASLVEGQLFYLSETTGGITSTRPTQPAHGVVLGWCIKAGAGTAGILYVKVDNGVELDELHDVLISSKVAGQALFVGVDGLWRNRYAVAADISDSSSTGRAVLTAANDAEARSAISAEQAGAAAAAVSAHAAATDPHPAYVLESSLGSAAQSPASDFVSATATTAANLVFAGPASGAAAAPTFRALVAADLPFAISSSAAQNLAATAAAGSTGQVADAGHVHQFQPTDIVIPLSGESSAITVSTLLTIPYWPRLQVFTAVPVWMLNGAPTGAAMQLDIRVGGTSIFSTLPTIAAAATNSTTTTAAVFSTAFESGGQTVAQGSSVTFICTQVGTGGGTGLKVAIPARRAA